MRQLHLNFDGSCGPKNPSGHAAWAFRIMEEGEEINVRSGQLGTGLGNNYGEFHALYEGLSAVSKLLDAEGAKKLLVFVKGDSQLVINIMNKKWKASPEKLYYPAAILAFKSLSALKSKGVTVFFDWIPREQNSEVDELSKYSNFSSKNA
jgi:ribonuclease HI